MNKIIILIIIVVLVIVAGIVYFLSIDKDEWREEIPFDIFNATYIIEEGEYPLVDGRLEENIFDGIDVRVKAEVWDIRPGIGDLNGDGVDEIALIIAREILGYNVKGKYGGKFYFLAVALDDRESGKVVGTNAIIIGERVAVESVSVDEGVIIVDYLARKDGEPVTVEPTIKSVKRFVLNEGVLEEVEKTPEEKCAETGGEVSTSLCCESTDDFPDLCMIGPCGCSPDNSHEVKICDCGEGCFDGEKCTTYYEL